MRGGPGRLGGPADPDLASHIRRAFELLPPKLRIVATPALIDELPQAETFPEWLWPLAYHL